MKIGPVVLFFAGVYALLGGQEGLSTNPTVSPSLGLQIGQRAPTFALPISSARSDPTRP